MSPAPYPPLQIGDDVDADFFDQLGDELDPPSQESGLLKHQDTGPINLSGPPGTAGFGVPGSDTWGNHLKIHPEVGRCQNQEGNSHLDLELEDEFSEFHTGTQEPPSISYNAEAQLLSNGHDPGLNLPAETPFRLEARVCEDVMSSESPVSGTETSGAHPVEESEAESSVLSGSFDDRLLSARTAPGPASEVPGPDLSEELSVSSDLAPETTSIVEETQISGLSATQGIDSPESSKHQAQTTEVQEVQWSNFGAQGGFGSFSDFLSVFPVDSSQSQDISSVASNAESDFFNFSELPTVSTGSNVPAQQYDSPFFDGNRPHLEQTWTPETPSVLSTAGYEPQAPVQLKGEEPTGYLQQRELDQPAQTAQYFQDQYQVLQSQGQEQQAQTTNLGHSQWDNSQPEGQVQQTQSGSYQSEWQEYSEYPGWLYNAVTGEWAEKSSRDGIASVDLSQGQSAGQYDSQNTYGVNQNNQWVGRETTSAQWQGGGTTADLSATHKNNEFVSGFTLASSLEASGTTESRNLLNETTIVQQDGVNWQASTEHVSGAQSQTGWEEQYPGWYYDHQAQEWKESSQIQGRKEINQANEMKENSQIQWNENSQTQWKENIGTHGWGTDGQTEAWKGYNQPASTIQVPESLDPVQIPVSLSGLQVPVSFSAVPLPSSLSSVQAPASPSAVQASTSLPSVSNGQHSSVPSLPLGYDTAAWSDVQSQSYNMGVLYAQDTFGSHGTVAVSLQNESLSSFQGQVQDQWTGGQQFVNQSAYYQSGKPQANGVKQQSEFMHQSWNSPYRAPQADPQIRAPEIQFNPYKAPQMPSYVSQPWSGYNSYAGQHFPAHDPQTPPKSTEEALRTSVGRPPQILLSFGFGGKLVVMKLKDALSLQSSDGSQSTASGKAWVPGSIHVHNLSQLVSQTSDNGRGETGNQFGALSSSTIAGPLVGGSVSSKELSKWLDERSTYCRSEEPNCRHVGSLSMLWGLLKLSCQHYGKLRSAAGAVGIISQQEEDGPEMALAKLLTSGGDQSSWTMGSFASTVCLQPVPSEHQLQVTASEVKKLLVSGKRKEALKHAQQGQLWGPALVLARQLGEKYYTETVAEMAQRQFLPGSPLRTLSLLLAGQPAEVFTGNGVSSAPNKQAIPLSSSLGDSAQDGLGSMLEEWQENLSIMAANRTSGDDRVISHLGDCLWKVKGEVASAHICYLVADANFESFSSSARLCLIGADHWKNPRTYATPEAIQRTEVYEYSKVLGNPQFILVPFQPYKVVYAAMLAESGKTAEALRYCQAVLKTLKTASRAPEVEICRQAAVSLEERLRLHAQGGHSVNLAPGKIVRGILSAIDRGIHGMIGGPPPSTVQEQGQMGATGEPVTLQDHLAAGRYGASPGRSPAPLVPSASAEKLKESGRAMPQRSVSEPDFSATMKEKAEQGKPTTRGGYLGRFGAVFSKAGGIVGMVAKSGKNEAKLGDKNKFYYDEKLKRWVEEGVDIPQEQAALAPPPMASSFVTKSEDSPPAAQVGLVSAAPPASKNAHLGTPPVPPSNQFSSRSRQQGVRSRYVDTFNKGGTSTPSKTAVSLFSQPAKLGGSLLPPTNFFVPGPSPDNSNGSVLNSENLTAVGSNEEHQYQDPASTMDERLNAHRHSATQNLFHQSGMVASSMQRVPSSENASTFGAGVLHRVPSSDNTLAFGSSAMHRVPSFDNTSVFGAGAMQRDPSFEGATALGAGVMHRVPSSDNTSAFGGVDSAQASGTIGRVPGNGDVGFTNGYHLRANSWGGYPSNFQTFQTETTSSHENSVTNVNMSNGFSSQGMLHTSASIEPYFPSPPKANIYKQSSSSGMIETFLPLLPSTAPNATPTGMGEVLPGPLEPRNGSQVAVSLVGDDLQEVEL